MKKDRSIQSVSRLFGAIRAALQAYPDLRVGQLIENARQGKDLFYLENDELAEMITRYVYKQD